MRRVFQILALILCLFFAVINLGNCVRADDDQIDGYVDSFRKSTKCNNVSVAVFDGEDVSFYGDSEGLYQIGSMTKAFTGLAIHKLMREGKLDLTSVVSEFIPNFSAIYDSTPYEITVEQLLTQTSGYNNSESLYPSATSDMSLQDWALSMSGKELQSIPGENYSYSNVNFDLLGAIIEKVSGISYKDYMESEILRPLGLNNTYVVVDPKDENIIRGSKLGFRHAFEYEIPVIEGRIPAGYFYSNTKDMARWIRIWLDIEDIPDEYRELVRETKSHLIDKEDYYSGWEVFDECIGHSGGTPNYSSRIVFSDEKQVGVCVLTNLNVAASTDSLCNLIFSDLVSGKTTDILADVWTIFDIIFTMVSVAGLLLAGFAIWTRKRIALLISGIIIALLVISILVVMPLVFGAGLKDIMFTWAPYSLIGAVVLLSADLIIIGIRFWKLRKNADREKTS